MNIGYEFECLSLAEDDEIEHDLKTIFGKSLAKKFEVTTDCTIKRDKQTRYADGWSGWEIITPPLAYDESMHVLESMQRYFLDTGIVTNKSCGFHVNISAKKMNNFDPMTLVSMVDEYKFAKTYNREENPYCIPWSYYFHEIWKRIKRDKKLVLDKKQVFNYNAHTLVDSASKGEFIDDCLELKYVTNVAKFFDEKYLTTNVSKLSNRSPYVEFRMMGGKDYHHTALVPMVRELCDYVEIAADGFQKDVVKEYLNQYCQ